MSISYAVFCLKKKTTTEPRSSSDAARWSPTVSSRSYTAGLRGSIRCSNIGDSRCLSLPFFFQANSVPQYLLSSLHDALPISCQGLLHGSVARHGTNRLTISRQELEEREIGRATSELQSHVNLVCRLLLEKKNNYRAKIL